MTDRKSELAGNLAKVEERIAAACAAAGRPRDEVTLIVVTKTYPAEDVRILSDLGVRHVAENRDQDAAPKAAACSDLPLSWHFVGQLQTNKVRSVVGYADVVQSVDRPSSSRLCRRRPSGPGARWAACSRSRSTPGRAPGRAGRRVARGNRRVGRPGRRVGGTVAGRADDGGAAHRRVRGTPTGGVRAPHGFVDLRAPSPSGCEHGLRRDERGPRAGRGRRGDTCTRRHRGTRSPPRLG